jgi:hypothetical protein
MRIVTDVFDRFIRVVVRDSHEFELSTLRFFDWDYENGVSVSLGTPLGEKTDTQLQSVLFDKENFDFKTVKKWLRANGSELFASTEITPKKEMTGQEFNYEPKEGKENFRMDEYKQEDRKTIRDVPIFKIGFHNNLKFGAKELEEMERNFKLLKKENPDFQVPIKLGHHMEEKPAAGWMENIRRVGNVLVADFVDMPSSVHELIKNKTFKNRSIEVIRNFVDSGNKKLGRVIKGIALLGSSLPAVNLPDIPHHSFGTGMDFDEIVYEDIHDKSGQESETKFNENMFDNHKENKNGGVSEMEKESEKETVAEFEAESGNVPEKEADIEIKEPIKEVFKEVQKVEEKQALHQEIKNETEVKNMEKEVSKEDKAVDKFRAEIAEFSNKSPEDIAEWFKSRDAELESYRAEKKEWESFQRDNFEKQTDLYLKGLIDSNKILPAEESMVRTLLFSIDAKDEIEFSISDYEAKKKDTPHNLFKSFLDQLPDRGLLRKHAEGFKEQSWESVMQTFAKEMGYSAKELDQPEIYKKVASYVAAKHPDVYENSGKR